MAYLYKAFGCNLVSDLRLSFPALKDAARSPADGGAVRIRLHDSGPPPLAPREETISILDEHRIEARNVGVFDVRRGAAVDIYPLPGVDESVLEMWLMGIAMSTLIFQRGAFVLHACAVRIGAHTVGLIGNIGDGKSTLTASLLARGHGFLADDLLALDFVDGAPVASTGFPVIKLSEEVAAPLGFGLDRVLSRHPYKGKSIYQAATVAPEIGYRLSHLFLLDRGPLDFRKMSLQESFVQLNRHSVPTRWGRPGGRRHFELCARVCKSVPFTIYRRPFALDEIGEQAKRLENFLEESDAAPLFSRPRGRHEDIQSGAREAHDDI